MANAGGDQTPTRGWLPGGSPKDPYDHLAVQSVAAFGSTAFIAQKWPPSSDPVAPESPKYTSLPVPSGSATTGEEYTVAPALNRQIRAPVVASSA